MRMKSPAKTWTGDPQKNDEKNYFFQGSNFKK